MEIIEITDKKALKLLLDMEEMNLIKLVKKNQNYHHFDHKLNFP